MSSLGSLSEDGSHGECQEESNDEGVSGSGELLYVLWRRGTRPGMFLDA